ncbi:hypothetical protein BCR35DRAFT_44844 [Leucosporidium creatinivorum]|uniref:Uncharacterized protein n=1 Tax=Leucosporidium creatinivorum TaxID=106004 RepID=A0A1Y2FRS0_9BASI|nr:hypothetical protein BCR35DRAFT_44844 [Leucosporidium creatinivorum]
MKCRPFSTPCTPDRAQRSYAAALGSAKVLGEQRAPTEDLFEVESELLSSTDEGRTLSGVAARPR